jgi:hypothetical protein
VADAPIERGKLTPLFAHLDQGQVAVISNQSRYLRFPPPDVIGPEVALIDNRSS